jgi:drug/metabolite transporter (DMT)-like permease
VSRRGWILFSLLSLVWGTPYLLIKIAMAEVSVPFLAFGRAGVGALVLLPFAFLQGGFGWLRASWLPVAAFCLVEMIAPWGLIAHGEIAVESSTAGLLVALTPVATVAITRLTGFGERLGLYRWAGLTMGLAGVFVLALPALGGSLLGIVEIVAAAVCYGAGAVIASRGLKEVPAIPLTSVCLVGAALAYAVPAALTLPQSIPSVAAIGSIIGLGIFCTALAFAAYFLLVREVGPERASFITYVAPAVSVLAGALVLAEPLDARLLGAFALILCGSWLGTTSSRGPPFLQVTPRRPMHVDALASEPLRAAGPVRLDGEAKVEADEARLAPHLFRI